MKRVLVPPPPVLSLAQKVVRAVVVFLVAGVLFLLLRELSFLLAPVGLAFVAFYSLNPIVNLLDNRGLTRRTAIALCFGALLLMLLIAGIFIWPSLDAWLQHVPQEGERSVFEVQLQSRLDAWAELGRRRFPAVDWTNIVDGARHGLETYRRRWMETLPALATSALSSAGIYLLTPVIALFLLLEGSRMHRAVVSLVPNRHFETVLVLLHRVDQQIAAYLRGAATQALIVSLLTATTLWLVGMPNATLFGFIFGTLNVIPLVGPILGASAGLLYSLLDPTAPSLPVLIGAYMAVHVVDLAVITPWVVGKSLDLHPLTIIIGLTIAGTVAGIPGMLLSIPLIAVAKAVLGTLAQAYRRDELT